MESSGLGTLSTIPLEIRTIIYRHILIEAALDERVARGHSQSCLYYNNDSKCPPVRNTTMLCLPTATNTRRICPCAQRSLGLLETSRTIHTEAHAVFWAENTFSVASVHELFLASSSRAWLVQGPAITAPTRQLVKSLRIHDSSLGSCAGVITRALRVLGGGFPSVTKLEMSGPVGEGEGEGVPHYQQHHKTMLMMPGRRAMAVGGGVGPQDGMLLTVRGARDADISDQEALERDDEMRGKKSDFIVMDRAGTYWFRRVSRKEGGIMTPPPTPPPAPANLGFSPQTPIKAPTKALLEAQQQSPVDSVGEERDGGGQDEDEDETFVAASPAGSAMSNASAFSKLGRMFGMVVGRKNG